MRVVSAKKKRASSYDVVLGGVHPQEVGVVWRGLTTGFIAPHLRPLSTAKSKVGGIR